MATAQQDLATINRHQQLGDFITTLYVMEGSSSDPLGGADPDATTRARDMLGAVPVLWWQLPAGEPTAGAVAMLQARAIGAVESAEDSLPLTDSPAAGVRVEVTDSSLRLVSDCQLGPLGTQPFAIEPRIAWFLRQCNTLGVVIETEDSRWIGSVTADGEPPRMCMREGALASKAYRALIERAADWVPVHLGNRSHLAGNSAFADDHYRTYLAAPDEVDLPDQVTWTGDCLACGCAGNSREHCVPNWIAKAQRSQPVTASLFCIDCNNHFGRELEQPIAAAVARGQLSAQLGTKLFARWAVKTALAVSAASGLRPANDWMAGIRGGGLPEGFEVFATGDVQFQPGYSYAVTYFSAQRAAAGLFLFSFVIDGLGFVVARGSDTPLRPPRLERVHPVSSAVVPPAETLDFQRMHAELLSTMTGNPTRFTPSPLRPVKSPRA